MTDHDQTTLELMYERRKTVHLWRIIVALFVGVCILATNMAIHAFVHGRDIAALTAKCGLERP